MQNDGGFVDVMLLFLAQMWTFTSLASDFVENWFNKYSRSFVI
jgi:hypothetical protein